MTDFLVTEMRLYPWFTFLLVFFALAGVAYAAVWVHDVASAGSSWLAYRREIWRGRAAMQRRLNAAPCAVCHLLEEGDDPLEYQHPDGPDPGYDWDGPGDDWSPGLAWGPGLPVPNPMAGLAEVLKRAHDLGLLDDDQLPDGPFEDPPGKVWYPYEETSEGNLRWTGPSEEAPEERCTNRDCDLFGFLHRPPCRLAPTMPVACYPDMDLTGPGRPAGPPIPWSGLTASLEVLARGDDSPTLTGRVAAELGHDTTEAAVDSMFTRAQAREVQAMITDGVIAPE